MKFHKTTKYALINAAIAGGLVFAGSFTSGHVSTAGVIASTAAAVIVFLTKLRDFYGNVSNKKAMVRPGAFVFYGA